MKTAHKIIRLDRTENSQMNEILSRIRNLERILEDPFDSFLIVPSEEGSSFISHNDILRCEANSNYCIIYLKEGSKACISKPLKWVADKLPSDLFMRVHCSHLINSRYIRKYIRSKNAFLELVNGKRIPVSRSRKSAFDALMQYT